MSCFYGDEAEELRQVTCAEELEFEYLFEYGLHAGHEDAPGSSSHRDLPSPASLSYPLEQSFGGVACDHSPYGEFSASGCHALSPRIEITPSRELYGHTLQTHPVSASPASGLTVPGLDPLAYRDAPCLSPASSNSSASWQSESLSPWASPCVSPGSGQGAEQLCPRLQGVLTGSPPSPRPRSTSPVYKRTYDMYRNPALIPAPRSRSPSPHAAPPPLHPPQGYLMSRDPEVKAQLEAEPFYLVPQDWAQQLIPVSSAPSLEAALPSRTHQYQLHIEVQPKPHHRAHYETEGSRGAVKASTGGHPVVQLRGYHGKEPLALQIFIGTADERILKPHAFYQVHRITGKSVSTNSCEKLLNGTKVLETPLEPKSGMRATIDCAGILKLRNADIELRKGETDIGRKNTRVRLVFRVHVPQPGGQGVSLQVASHPIECSQRSAHELPLVEKQDMDVCSVLGGQQMILSGQNFSADSRVMFMEKTQDGQQVWEVEATVDKDKSQSSLLFIQVPPYRDQSITHSVKVNFYVINGKRKRSQPQHFTYTPLPVPVIKTEPLDDYESRPLGVSMMGVAQPYYSPREVTRFPPQSAGVVVPRPVKSPCGGPLVFPQLHTSSPHPSIIHFSPSQHLLYSDASPTPDPYPGVIQQRSRCPRPRVSPQVTVKQENLDQAYLDDVNEIIRNDLTGVNGSNHT